MTHCIIPSERPLQAAVRTCMLATQCVQVSVTNYHGSDHDTTIRPSPHPTFPHQVRCDRVCDVARGQ